MNNEPHKKRGAWMVEVGAGQWRLLEDSTDLVRLIAKGGGAREARVAELSRAPQRLADVPAFSRHFAPEESGDLPGVPVTGGPDPAALAETAGSTDLDTWASEYLIPEPDDLDAYLEPARRGP